MSNATLSERDARTITADLRAAMRDVANTWQVLVTKAAEAYARRVWVTLGYPSWRAYCEAEVNPEGLSAPPIVRVSIVHQLAESGMTNVAIAPVVGTSEPTVRRDLNSSNDELPPRIDSLGRELPRVYHRDEQVPQVPGAEQTRPVAAARRRPLVDWAAAAGWTLRKAVERVERVLADDRLGRNKVQVAATLRGDLLYVAGACDRMLVALGSEGEASRDGGDAA